jgi:hypothetical protein
MQLIYYIIIAFRTKKNVNIFFLLRLASYSISIIYIVLVLFRNLYEFQHLDKKKTNHFILGLMYANFEKLRVLKKMPIIYISLTS